MNMYDEDTSHSRGERWSHYILTPFTEALQNTLKICIYIHSIFMHMTNSYTVYDHVASLGQMITIIHIQEVEAK